jgi:hypothetical protein
MACGHGPSLSANKGLKKEDMTDFDVIENVKGGIDTTNAHDAPNKKN